jgi:RND family efflux transporter MFP subunit
LALVVGALAIALSTTDCGGGGASGAPAGPPGGPGAMPPMPVEVIALEARPIEDSAEFVGTLKSRRSSTIQPQAEGFITRIHVKSGDRVTAGTPMFDIDSSTQQAAVASFESVRTAREADAALARQQLDRARKLLEVGALSQQEFDQAAAAAKAADAQVKSAEEQIRQQRAELAYYQVVAPAPGVVGDVPVRVGDRVTKATALTTVDDNTGLEIYINVPVERASRLRLGLPVHLLDEAGLPIASERVNFVAASVDDATQTVLVKAPLSRAGFRADQFVRARVVFGSEPGLAIPVTSALRISGQYFVYVAEPAGGGFVAKQRNVSVARVVGQDYVVTGGVKPGERLIVSGIQRIGDGAPVQPTPPAASAPATAPAGGGR